MKKLFYLLFLISSSVYCQEYTSRDGILLSDLKTKYIIIEKPKVSNKKTYVYLDYGQELKTGVGVNAIKLEGEKVKFSSILNVLNLLNNYEVIQMINDEVTETILLKYIREE